MLKKKMKCINDYNFIDDLTNFDDLTKVCDFSVTVENIIKVYHCVNCAYSVDIIVENLINP